MSINCLDFFEKSVSEGAETSQKMIGTLGGGCDFNYIVYSDWLLTILRYNTIAFQLSIDIWHHGFHCFMETHITRIARTNSRAFPAPSLYATRMTARQKLSEILQAIFLVITLFFLEDVIFKL